MTNEWDATTEEIQFAIFEQAEPIWEECPTCHDGSIKTGRLGLWNSHKRIPVDDVLLTVAHADEKKWRFLGNLNSWSLWLKTGEEEQFFLKPPKGRLQAFLAQRMREKAEALAKEADELTAIQEKKL